MPPEIKVNNLYEYLDMIRERPVMYIGQSTLSALNSHIKGYIMACDLKHIDEVLQPDFHLFHDFVANYYLRSNSTAGWLNIILAENYGNEEQALKSFYKLFDIFRQSPKLSNAKKILFKILKELISKPDNVEISTHEIFISFHQKLKAIPEQLESANTISDYDKILEDLEKYAEYNSNFKVYLEEIKKSVS